MQSKISYRDDRYLFMSAFPEFIDGIFKLRFQYIGKSIPNKKWELLDANLYFPDQSQSTVKQINQQLVNSLGKPHKKRSTQEIEVATWMLGEFIELGVRVDSEVGNVTLSYSVLQGELPF